MPPAFAWQALDGQGWPASPEQERMFVAELRRASGGGVSPETPGGATVVLNALRCGASYDDLTALLPGLDPAALLGAYLQLATRLDRSRKAWQRLVTDPVTGAAVPGRLPRRTANVAGLLMPVPVHRIRLAAGHLTDPVPLSAAVAEVVGQVARVTSQAQLLHGQLGRLPARNPRGVQLGRSLHDVAQPGLWTHPYFLPGRVGELSSTRVRDLRAGPRP